MVHFAGEDRIDTGAIHKKFLSNIISDISREMFPNGAPVDSSTLLHGDKGIEGSVEFEDDTVASETTPDLSPAGIFKWLTGQRHKNGEKAEITVDFDHECLNRNPDHKI